MRELEMRDEVLLIEDEPFEAEPVINFFKSKNIPITWVKNVEDGKRALISKKFSLLLVDYQLPDGDGLQILSSLKTPRPPVYMISAYGSISRAVEAVRLGAHDFFEKPVAKRDLEKIIARAGPRILPDEKLLPQDCGIIYATGSPLEKVFTLCDLVGEKNCNVFIRGESGTGKELAARYLHAKGPGHLGPLIEVNCGAIPENLIESELFGYKKGAFTGALQDTRGKIESARGGTLFLDEIGDMPFFMQTKMLRVLQEKCVTPIGHHREIPVDFRLICATHKNLAREVELGRFREDLYYRINVIEIKLPALKKRKKDIPILLRSWIQNRMDEKDAVKLINSILSISENYDWPGNVRELKNFLDRFIVYRQAGKSPEEVFAEYIGEKPKSDQPRHIPVKPAAKMKRTPTDSEILSALEAHDYHRKSTASHLGISLRSLQYKIAGIRKKNLEIV